MRSCDDDVFHGTWLRANVSRRLGTMAAWREEDAAIKNLYNLLSMFPGPPHSGV